MLIIMMLELNHKITLYKFTFCFYLPVLLLNVQVFRQNVHGTTTWKAMAIRSTFEKNKQKQRKKRPETGYLPSVTQILSLLQTYFLRNN